MKRTEFQAKGDFVEEFDLIGFDASNIGVCHAVMEPGSTKTHQKHISSGMVWRASASAQCSRILGYVTWLTRVGCRSIYLSTIGLCLYLLLCLSIHSLIAAIYPCISFHWNQVLTLDDTGMYWWYPFANTQTRTLNAYSMLGADTAVKPCSWTHMSPKQPLPRASNMLSETKTLAVWGALMPHVARDNDNGQQTKVVQPASYKQRRPCLMHSIIFYNILYIYHYIPLYV